MRRDAALCFRRFGEYGVSVLRASHELEVERLAGGPLRYFDVLTVLKVGALRSADLEVRPTFRSPHCCVMLPDLEADIGRLLACENTETPNRHYEPPEWER